MCRRAIPIAARPRRQAAGREELDWRGRLYRITREPCGAVYIQARKQRLVARCIIAINPRFYGLKNVSTFHNPLFYAYQYP